MSAQPNHLSDSEILRAFVDQYELEVDGVRFWTPYFRNNQDHDDEKKPNLPAPFLGKGTPDQLKVALSEALSIWNEAHPQTAEEYRQFMREHLLGVECSGFAFYLYENYLEERYGKDILDGLFWTREELLESYDKGIPWHSPELERETVEDYPDSVSLSKIAQDWRWKEPRWLVRAMRFEASANELESIKDLRPGDFIYSTDKSLDIGHLVIIIEADEKSITYAHSGRIEGQFDGVHYAKIKVTDPRKPIESQDWEEKGEIKYKSGFRLMRLKLIADGA